MQHIISLRSARERLRSGYARDLVSSFLEPADSADSPPAIVEASAEWGFDELDAVDAGDLFRTLVLDEHWDIEQAAVVYYSALATLEARG